MSHPSPAPPSAQPAPSPDPESAGVSPGGVTSLPVLEGPPPQWTPAGTQIIDYDAAGLPVAPPATPDRAGSGSALARIGDYDILSEVARGGMGVVYRARHRTLLRTVALKTLLQGSDASDNLVQRFLLEASAAARLQHVNIVQVYEVGAVDGVHFYAMEFVEGRTFSESIEKDHVSPAAAVDVVRTIARALAYAHDHRIIHRDIKPQNILIDRQGTAKLSDFGLAKDLSRDTALTASGIALGTPLYMSPEQAMGQTRIVDHRSDVYSLGAVLYHALTGRPPFDGDNALSIMNKVALEEPRAVGTFSREINRDLETICHKAMAKHPGDRYASAADFAEDLDRWREGRQIRARRPGVAERAWRFVLRHRRASLVAAITLTMLAVVVTQFLRIMHRRSDALRELEVARARAADLMPRGAPGAQEYDVLAETVKRGDEALAALRRALEFDPNCDPARRLEAELLLRLGRPGSAARAATRLCEEHSADAEAAWLLVRCRLADDPPDRAATLPALAAIGAAAPAGRAAIARARLRLLEGHGDEARAELADHAGDPGFDAFDAACIEADARMLPGPHQDPAAARQILTAALQSGRGTHADHLRLARWSAAAQDPATARRAYLEAAALSPQPAIILLERGKTLAEIDVADAAAAAEWHALAAGDLHYAADALPHDPMPQIVLCRFWSAAGEFARADAHVRQALALVPNLPLACLEQLKLVQRSPTLGDPLALWQTLRVGPLSDAAVLADRGILDELLDTLQELGLHDETSRLSSAGLQRYPDDWTILHHAGQLHLRRHETDAALACFNRAIELCRPPHYKLLVWRARVWADRKDYKAAVQDLSEAIRLEPNNRDLYVKRGTRYLQLWQIDDAMTDIETATLMAPIEEIDGLRASLLGSGPNPLVEKLDAGLRKFAESMLPRLSRRLSNRGFARLRKEDDAAGARAAFERARLIHQEDWAPHYGLALVHAHNRAWDDAALRLAEAIALGMDNTRRIEEEPLLDELRLRPEWQRVVKAIADRKR